MKTPVDRNDAPLSAYLLKILTILVKKSGGEIRIDALDMMDESAGEGVTKRYDREKKQLVLSFLESGSEIFFNKAGDEWQSPMDRSLSPDSRSLRSQDRGSQRSSLVRPLQPSDLTDDSQLSRERERMASTLDDSRIADLEDHLRKEAAARIVANFPGTPVTEPARQPLRTVASRQPNRKVQPSFFRD